MAVIFIISVTILSSIIRRRRAQRANVARAFVVERTLPVEKTDLDVHLPHPPPAYQSLDTEAQASPIFVQPNERSLVQFPDPSHQSQYVGPPPQANTVDEVYGMRF
ncbi:hypothetical protein FRB94_002704 [Tulasnella sp. JGI-2019a]|nr:hypothetical protein FRB94_002704 [Tulasnella sp. JGI-2019a]KAG9033247.1 hypothetical protein FRB95_000426 [Tulasnella sp. JGI-2019a]